MRVAVAFGVLATLALAYGAPHGVVPHTLDFVDQKLIAEHVKPVYGYRVRTSSAHDHHPFAFGYKIKAGAPVVVHSEESAAVEGHSVGSGGFNYAFKTVAPVGGVIATPVTFSSRRVTERIHGQESVEGVSGAADTVKVDGDQYLSVAPGPVAVTYERTLHHAGSKAQGEGAFSYSYHADSPVVSGIHAAVLPASVAVVKSGEGSDKSGSFSYSVTADAPATVVAAAPVGVAVEHRLAGFGEKISDDKSSGSFSYSYHADAPVLTAPVVHHSVVHAPVPITSYVKTVDHIENAGSRGAFSYSVSADAPLVGHSAAVVEAAQVVDAKSVDTHVDDKSSGSFSYSYSAEAPVAGAVVAPVVAAPVHTAYTTSVVSDEANIANRGSFSYSVTADAPVVAPVSYVASAPVGVSYEHTVVEAGDRISDDKSSGAFGYSYSVNEPAVVHHSVAAAPAYTGSIVKTVDHVEDAGSRGAFSYSVTADAPLVGHSAAVVEAAQVVDAKSVDTHVDDKSSGSFSYSFSAEAPVRSAVVAPVVAAPVHTAYTTSVVKDEANIANRGSFSYSVTADAPVVAPVSYVASAPVGVEYEQTVVQYGDKVSDDKGSGAFGYSYHVDAPVVHHSVVAHPFQTESLVKTVEYSQDVSAHEDASSVQDISAGSAVDSHVEAKTVGVDSAGKPSGAFSYSFSAEAPIRSAVVAPVVAAPVHTAYTTSVVSDEANIANRGSFSYSVTADAPVVAPVSYVASAPVGVSYEHTVVEAGDRISDDKSSGAFGYSYSVNEPAVVHHSVAAAPAYTGSIVKTVDHVEDAGSRGAFSYSVTADAPLVGHSAAVVEAAQVVDAKSVDTHVDDKSSGSFSYSFSAEAPVRSAVVAPVVAAPVHTAYTTSVVKDEANIANRGSFSYSVTADAPVVAPVSYVASAPVGVEYDHTVVQYGDKVSDEKSSGAFGYSYQVDAPVVHHSVVAQPVQVVHSKAVDTQAEDKTSNSFSYSFSAEAPVASAVVSGPVHSAYTTSVVNDEAAIGNRGSFSYSVSADAPVVAPVSYVASVPAGVEYEQTVVQYGDKVSDHQGAGGFGYSYHVDTPAVAHAVVAQPIHTESFVKTVDYSDAAAHGDAHFESKSMDASSEGKSSGSFSYSISAEAPVASVGAPVFHSSSVVGAVPVAVRGSVLKTDYINPINTVSLGVTADDLKLHSIGSFDGVYGVRTAPVNTYVTGIQHAPLGYGVPITVKCD